MSACRLFLALGLVGEGTLITLQSSRFGKIEIDEAEILDLPSGLIGFPELTKFILLDHEKDSPFKWLQSIDDGSIAFVLINPLLFKPDYSVEATEGEVSDLALTREEDAVISVIITMPSDPQKMTANLKAPLIFNLQNRKGKQIILNNTAYTTRHNILEELKKYEAMHASEEKIRGVFSSPEQAAVATEGTKAAKG